MAVNIFDKYGIKEVANVYFEALENDTKAGVYKGDIVLFLDTLKVSTIETTAENVAAQGGWGNPRLISWDYGKEINVTLTDALMSLESLRFMMGGTIKEASTGNGGEVWVHLTAEGEVGTDGKVAIHEDKFKMGLDPTAEDGHPIKVINLTRGTRTQIKHTAGSGAINSVNGKCIKFVNPSLKGIAKLTADEEDPEFDATGAGSFAKEGDILRFFWEEKRTGEDGKGAVEVTISPDTFPGTYRVVGDTFMRNSRGKDEPFQFVIEKAKVQSNVTLTLEAEGDPTTFEMTLQVLRADSGDEMMKLVRYDTPDTAIGSGIDEGSIAASNA